jgi:acyl-coenzyme A synthetase/AMP-(fatty) acid ligase
LSPIEMPRVFEFCASLPKSTYGKVLKHQLRGLAAEPVDKAPGGAAG